jgi:selenocysteine-specific elongation factor
VHVIGTAGHVDHGKSSLVAALTGTNPDRWIEEQLRGMTLDLGFAHLQFEDGSEAGIVDVPGHARFLHNMLAGAAGMELLLLVVAADDGVMPQTLEHLQILRYLNVRRTVIALSKIDTVLDRAEARARVAAQLSGTLAEGAPMIATSTTTGEGLDELKAMLAEQLAAIETRDAQAPVYLPIDRVFTLPGRGTIVTGTLMQGTIAAGDTLQLDPLGRRVRVRSLQVFGAARDRVQPGTRVALNLTGVDRTEASRGSVLASESGPLRSVFAVRFSAVDQDALTLLRRRTPVRAHIGSAEVLGTLVFDTVPVDVREVTAQLYLREPVHAFPGVRFVVRRVSPKTLLGGGEIAGIERGEDRADVDSRDGAMLAFLREQQLEAPEVAAIAYAANVREDIAAQRLAQLEERGEVVAIARPAAWLAAEIFDAFAQRVRAALETAHHEEPWAMGLTSLALSRALAVREALLVRLLAALSDDGRIAARHGYYAIPDHTPKLTAEQREYFEHAVPFDPAQPFVPADFVEIAASARRSAIAGLAKAFETLQVRGVLVKVGDALYRGTQVEKAHELVEAYIVEHGSMTMAQFRDLLGTSRKYAVPFLEWFDSRGITVRSGDVRMLRARKGAVERSV